ncbi:MAG: hypothetical protein Fur005_14640 [Roseiflexaceae bacterium]
MRRLWIYALALLLLPWSAAPAAAAPPTASGCTLNGTMRTCSLWALNGSLNLPNTPAVPIWGLSESATGLASSPGPTIVANQGETLQIVLTNQLAANLSLAIADLEMTPDLVGAAPGASQTYTFNLSDAGTFLYEAGPTPAGARQTAMGIFGAVVVQPSTPAPYAVDEVLVLSEVDPAFHAAPTSFNMTQYNPSHYLLNGREFPELPPVLVGAGNQVLLRVVNAGSRERMLSLLGLRMRIIAVNGLARAAKTVVAETIPPGSTFDVAVQIPATATLGTRYAMLDLGIVGGSSTQHGVLGFLEVGNTGPVADTTGPLASSLSVVPTLIGLNGQLSIGVTISDTTTGGHLVDAAEYFIDTLGASGSGTAFTSTAFPTTTVTLAAMITPPSLATGSHTLYVRGRDSLGNWGAPAAVAFGVDVSGPAIGSATLTPSRGNGTSDINLSANADDSTTGNSLIVGGEFSIDSAAAAGSGIAIGAVANAVQTSIAGTIPAATLATLSEGNHTIFIRAQDSLGNWGNTTSVVLTIDRTGPTVASVVVNPASNSGTQSVVVTASLSDPISSGVRSTIAGGEAFIGTVGTPGSGTAVSASDGNFNGTTENVTVTFPASALTGLTPGNYTVSLRGRDTAGNWGSVTTANFTIASQALFANSFESGNTSAWSTTSGNSTRIAVTTAAAMQGTYGLRTTFSGNQPSFVQDTTPANETTYRASFLFNPNSSSTGTGQHAIFLGRNTAGTAIFQVQYRRTSAGVYQIRAGALRTNGGTGTTWTSWYTISNGSASRIQITWQSASSASFVLAINGTTQQTLTGLNTSNYTLDSVRLGPSTGLSAAMSGTEYYDDFTSTRSITP